MADIWYSGRKKKSAQKYSELTFCGELRAFERTFYNFLLLNKLHSITYLNRKTNIKNILCCAFKCVSKYLS